VATALGIILFLSPTVAFLLAVVFAVVLWLTRFVSASSLAAAAALPVLMAFLGGRAWYEVTLSLVVAFLVFWTHRENIRRLWDGTENRFGGASKDIPE
jgi:glycerol-3-phosphate acyltransferase PlsY